MSIAILCPSKDRVIKFRGMVNSAYKTAYKSESVCIYLGIAEEDTQKYGYGSFLSYKFPLSTTAHKWNKLAEIAMQNLNKNLFMLGADDMIFTTPGWDKALLDHYNALDNKIHVYALQDSRDENGTPHIIVTREYIEAMGWFVPPIFLHWFIDSWTVAIAKANNCFTHMKDYLLIHDKPSDNGQADETHSRIREWGWHERDRWVADKCVDVLDMYKQKLASNMLWILDGEKRRLNNESE